MLLLVQNKPPTLLSMRRQHCVRYLVYSLRLERLHPCKLGKAGGGRERHMAAKGCRSKNVSMFFSNSIANRKGFLPCLSPFRAWTGVTSEKVGSWQTDTGRALTGKIDLDICSYVWESSGVLSGLGASDGINPQQGAMNGQQTAFDFDASRSWGDTHTGTEFAPTHILQPVIIYLGNHV